MSVIVYLDNDDNLREETNKVDYNSKLNVIINIKRKERHTGECY